MNMYTKEVNCRIIISLLKVHGINKVIASPGATNVAFIGSIQNDPYFTVYSAVDERSAAYMACGLAEESGEPVVLSCTGATASRNYLPGLTEAFYRKLPILAITSTQAISKIGHLEAQVIDRSVIQNDIAKLSVTLPIVKDEDDIWDCEIKINSAILELKRNGGGPAHINLPTTYTLPFTKEQIPKYRKIERITKNNTLPKLNGKVAIFIGSHKKWTDSETKIIDDFCSSNNAVVFCDHTSGYKGKYKVLSSILLTQESINKSKYKPEVLIHIGEISGDYASLTLFDKSIVWRVNQDGEIRDTFKKLEYVFEMNEVEFFTTYTSSDLKDDTYFHDCNESVRIIREKIPNLPFSNIWIANNIAKKIPDNSLLHLGILNTLRSWNLFEVPNSVDTTSNVGGFGIDGVLSTLVGSSLYNKDKLFFCILGDLAFFYDMNTMGNRHISKNLRILLINNGKGTEFKQYNHRAAYFGDKADNFIAAAEHFGNKSPELVKNYAENLGFEYLCASNKNEFRTKIDRFLAPEITNNPMIFEIFTESEKESKALYMINNIIEDSSHKVKKSVKKVVGNKGFELIKKAIGR